MKIAEFCKKHAACKDGREWAMSLGIETVEELWKRGDIKPEWRLWIATRAGVLPDRELRLFACFCARQNWHLLTDNRSRHAVEVAERFATGNATDEELSAARTAASAAAYAASAASAAYAAAYAAYASADSASAASYAAYASAADDASAADAQSEWLRKNTTPNFGGHNAKA